MFRCTHVFPCVLIVFVLWLSTRSQRSMMNRISSQTPLSLQSFRHHSYHNRPTMSNLYQDLVSLSAHELQELLQKGSVTSVDLVRAALELIAIDEKTALRPNAMISTRPKEQALQVATELDEERRAGHLRSRLHGLPLIVKVSLMHSNFTHMDQTSDEKFVKGCIHDKLIDGNAYHGGKQCFAGSSHASKRGGHRKGC